MFYIYCFDDWLVIPWSYKAESFRDRLNFNATHHLSSSSVSFYRQYRNAKTSFYRIDPVLIFQQLDTGYEQIHIIKRAVQWPGSWHKTMFQMTFCNRTVGQKCSQRWVLSLSYLNEMNINIALMWTDFVCSYNYSKACDTMTHFLLSLNQCCFQIMSHYTGV